MAVAAIAILEHHHHHNRHSVTSQLDSPEDERFAGIPRNLRPYFKKAAEAELPIFQKLNDLAFEDIEYEEVTELVQTLAPEEELFRKIPLSRVRKLLCSPILEDPLIHDEADVLLGALMQEGRDEDEVYVSPQELLVTLRGSPGAEEFVKNRKARYDKDGREENQMTRSNLQLRIEEVTNRHDAFLTLPITVIYTVLFVFLVMGHLRIFDRQILEKSMEEFVNGRDPRETADENVDDIDSWWEWVLGPGTRGPFAQTTTSKNGFTSCRLAARNYLLGDVRIRYIKFDGTKEEQWLLTSTVGQNATSHGLSYVEAAREAARHFQTHGWLSDEIEWMYLEFNSYNEFNRMFGMTEVGLPLKRSGDARTRINTDAVCIEPYPNFSLLVMDCIFCCIVFYIMLCEVKDVCLALKGGLDELWDYFQFWNCVDWFNILLSAVNIVLWFLLMNAMEQEPIMAVLDMTYKLSKDAMRLSELELKKLDEALQYLRLLYICMHFFMAILTASVVLKFFKAFQSNRRLRVVTDTFKAAVEDLLHFFITFSTIYLPFTLIGHIMFGSDIPNFASIISSLNTGFVCLMGDFGWYVEITEGMTLAETLPSGIPKLAVMLWFFLYMFLMFLVLLNMLLAVIMEHYLKVTEERNKQFEKPTIWRQAREYMQFKKETKKMLSLEYLRRGLEDDDNPAHEQEDVTAESLKAAWPEMKDDQTEWLLAWLQAWLDGQASMSKSNEEKTLSMSESNRELALANKEKIETLTAVVMKNKGRIDRVIDQAENQLRRSQKGAAGGTSLFSRDELDAVAATVKELATFVSKVRRDQERLARRVEELTLAVPHDLRNATTAMSKAKAPEASPRPVRISIGKSAGTKERKEKKEKKEKALSGEVHPMGEDSPAKSTRSSPGGVRRTPTEKNEDSSSVKRTRTDRTEKRSPRTGRRSLTSPVP